MEKKCPPLMVGDLILTISSQSLPRQGGSLVSHREVTPMVTVYSCCKKLPNHRSSLCVLDMHCHQSSVCNLFQQPHGSHSQEKPYIPLILQSNILCLNNTIVVFASICQCFTVVLKICFHVKCRILTCCFLITGFIQ